MGVALESHAGATFIAARSPDQIPRSGFSQRTPGNRAKSPSVLHTVRPCSIASAARCASGTGANGLNGINGTTDFTSTLPAGKTDPMVPNS
jgi:hypothetical protein